MMCLSQKPTDSSGTRACWIVGTNSQGLLVITHSEKAQDVAGEGSHAEMQAALFRDKCPFLALGHEHNTAHIKHRDETKKRACAVGGNPDHLSLQKSSQAVLERSERTECP